MDSADLRESIDGLLESTERVIGLRLALHDYHQLLGPENEWRYHRDPACMQVKAVAQNRCASFDGGRARIEAGNDAEGRVHTCPFGHTEIVVPVLDGGLQSGMLFAGPCWCGPGRPPRDGLVVPPHNRWLDDRRRLLVGLAGQIGELLAAPSVRGNLDRRSRILRFVHERISEQPDIDSLAEELCLSRSRTRHVVQELFSCSLAELSRSIKLREAAAQLASCTDPIGEIARRVGIVDANYFTRCFKQLYNEAPRDYRTSHLRSP